MKKQNVKTILGILAGAALSLAIAAHAFAMTPTLTLSSNGYNTLQATVYGDANAPVILDYYSGGQLMGAGIIGYTNYSGSFSSQLNPAAYNIPNGAQVLVVVNGQQSASVIWTSTAYNNGNGGYSTGTLSLSQTNLALTTGQSTTVTAYSNSGSLYVSTNTNSNVATVTAYSNQITVIGQSYGSTTLTICSTYGGCSQLYITVSGTSSGQQTMPILSQTSANLTVGQSQAITISNSYTYNYGYSGNQYYISNNANGIVTATINGNTINLYGQATGSTTLTICSSNNGSYNTYNNNGCATLYVTVTGGYYYPPTAPYYPPTTPYYPPVYNNAPLTLSNNNVQVTVGNVGTVILYGGSNGSYDPNNYYGSPYGTSGNFYVSNNNNGIANATINGTTLSIYGTSAGSTTITVCQSGSNQCASVYVTVIAPYYYNYGNNGQYTPSQNGDWYYSTNDRYWKHR